MENTTINSKRDEIVSEASKAFQASGFRGTAVDKVLAASGISKRTLYKHFRSKEELIAAVVAQYQDQMLVTMSEKLAPIENPHDKILALFDMRAEILEAEDFTGCLATNARLEFRDEHDNIADATACFYRRLETIAQDLCRAANCRHPDRTGRQIVVLLIGTIVCGQLLQDADVANAAKAAAAGLLAQDAG